ncbi:MAG: hypothetical protein LBP68_01610 [Acidobacteriota bacterium]|jgi:hypothetical protein|nr:hypothetical protein [Acidobacteriota bacterium]
MADAVETQEKEKERIDWHAAFFDAIRAEFAGYRDVLDFLSEYQLVAGSLRIDVLIIKKKEDVAIEKNIGRIFRKVNFVEYKGPDESLSVERFYRVCGYICIYRSLAKEAGIPEVAEIPDMSVSFVVRVHPYETMKHLRDTFGFTFEEMHPGIYVTKDGIIPMQVIDSKRLSEDENLWLQSLTNDLKTGRLGEVIDRQQEDVSTVGEMSAFLHALLEGNPQATKKGVDMLDASVVEAIERVGLGDKWRAQGAEAGIEKNRLETAHAMFLEGISLEKIERVTKIPMERLKQELQVQ